MFSEAEIARITKPIHVAKSHLLLRKESFGVYRAMCIGGCGMQFDLLGELKPGTMGATETLDAVTQACIEHAERCSNRKKPASVQVMQNRNRPEIFKVEIEWT